VDNKGDVDKFKNYYGENRAGTQEKSQVTSSETRTSKHAEAKNSQPSASEAKKPATPKHPSGPKKECMCSLNYLQWRYLSGYTSTICYFLNLVSFCWNLVAVRLSQLG
jgi:hypothetical protein